MKKILVIPDSHTEPGQDLSRFDWAAKLIVHQRPDLIVELGDFMSVDSLSSWNRNKRLTLEQMRFEHEVDSAIEAIKRLFAPLQKLQQLQRRQHMAIYRPITVHCGGNHEDRVPRYAETHPEMALTLDRRMERVFAPHTFVIPYKEFYEYNGIMFTHAPCNAAGSPVAGKYALARATDLVQKSTVFGHLHRREHLNFARHGMDQQDVIQIFSAGAFFKQVDSYVAGATNHYCRCLQLLHVTGYGRFDPEEWSLTRLEQVYG